jgi:uncharacterized protein (TIGR02466 family)
MKMHNDKVHIFNLFPTPLYVTNYEGDTTALIEYFDSCEMNSAKGPYGMISKNSYIIDNPICKIFSNWLMFHFREFATDVMRYDYEELQFAQSWLTYKEPGQFHKAHTHPNTLIAGVFYYDTHEDDAAICFSKESRSFNRSYLEPSLLPDYQEYPHSQEEIYFKPKKNNLIIFPSYLTHGVPPNNTNRVRKALGVNALTKGKLGDKETISEIIFGRYV